MVHPIQKATYTGAMRGANTAQDYRHGGRHRATEGEQEGQRWPGGEALTNIA